MADKHSLNYDVRELKLGASFTNNKASQYHTIKYDFKPASVDVNKMATVDVGTNNQVTVTVPHLDGAGVPQTVFKGSQRPYTKECVLIIDRVTGEITLEKLSSNIQVKKTRQETSQKPRPLTPVTSDFMNTTQRSTSRTRVTTNKRTNNQGAGSAQSSSQPRFNNNAQKTQNNMMRSPPRVKTSPPQAPWSAGGNSTHASLPMIGLDDALAGTSPPPAPAHNAHVSAHNAHVPAHNSHGSAHNGHPPAHNVHSAHATVHTSHASAHNAHVPAHNAHASAHNAHNANVPAHVPAPVRHLPPPASILPPPANTQPQAPRPDDSSSSSSSDSDSGSGSDSDSDDNDSSAQQSLTNGTASNTALPTDVLNDDLCLSESGSDSD